MTPHRDAQKRYCSRAIGAAIVIGGILILAGFPHLGKGLIAGALFSILNFVLMAESLSSRLGKSRGRASLISFFWILPRYALMAVPLVLSLKFHLFHPVTAAIGLFAVQLVILAEHIVYTLTSSVGGNA
jgi:hypothetical protein